MSRAALPALLCLALKSMLWEWAQMILKVPAAGIILSNLSPVSSALENSNTNLLPGAEPREGENGILSLPGRYRLDEGRTCRWTRHPPP
jgi:hypothetical protein